MARQPRLLILNSVLLLMLLLQLFFGHKVMAGNAVGLGVPPDRVEPAPD